MWNERPRTHGADYRKYHTRRNLADQGLNQRVPYPSFAYFAIEDGEFDFVPPIKIPAQAKAGRGHETQRVRLPYFLVAFASASVAAATGWC
jgi:hypothetical protein